MATVRLREDAAPLRADARLREKSYGVAECRPQAWLDERFIAPPAVGDRRSDHEGIAGAETKGEFAERIYARRWPRCSGAQPNTS